MRIISWNVNGVRAVCKKGFLEWLKKEMPDILCLQEIKSSEHQLPKELLTIDDYFTFVNPAKRPGYSGTMVFSKKKPVSVNYSLGLDKFDNEGRFIELKYENFTLINVYMPNGGRIQERFPEKFVAFDELTKYLKEKSKEKIIIVGDFNVAHNEIDLARPKENQKNTGFTLAERKEIDRIIEIGYIDTFRHFNKQGGNYTWWSPFSQARKRNIGWRIDYVFCSKPALKDIKKAFIMPKVMGSDHCPVGVELIGK